MSARARALIVLVSAFFLGCAVGAGSLYLWGGRVLANRTPQTELPPRRPLRLSAQLKMTPDQEERFRQIMEDSRTQLEAVRAEEEPKLRAIRAEMNGKISAILTDSQRKEFEAFEKQMEGRRGERGRRRPDWGPPSSPPATPPSK